MVSWLLFKGNLTSAQYLPKEKLLQNVKELFHYSFVLFFLMQDPYSLDIGIFFTGMELGFISYVISGN
jgi:hypothetical protein